MGSDYSNNSNKSPFWCMLPEMLAFCRPPESAFVCWLTDAKKPEYMVSTLSAEERTRARVEAKNWRDHPLLGPAALSRMRLPAKVRKAREEDFFRRQRALRPRAVFDALGVFCAEVDNSGRMVNVENKLLEPGEKGVWKCNMATRKGDLILVNRDYLTVLAGESGSLRVYDTRYLVRATTDAAPSDSFPGRTADLSDLPGNIRGMNSFCECESLFKFPHPVPVRDFYEQVENIPTLHEEFFPLQYGQGPISGADNLYYGMWLFNGMPMPRNVWRHLNQMLAEENPDYSVEMKRRGIDLGFSWDEPRLHPESKRESPPLRRVPVAADGPADPEIIRKVEKAAVAHVRKRLRAEGWRVSSVETMKCGYDLHCVKPDGEMHVEVKGTRGDEASFMLTRGEHERAQSDPKFVLYLVLRALDTPRIVVFSGEELLRKFDFQTVQYKATEK